MLTKKYLYADLDGTLIADDKTISPENLEALRRFAEAGGRFGVATGRSDSIALPYLQQLPVSAPVILYNGAGVYDLAAKRYLAQSALPDGLAQTLLTLATRRPEMTGEAYTGEGFRLICGAGTPDHIRAMGSRGESAVPEECRNCMKLLFFAGLNGHDRLYSLEQDFRAVPGLDDAADLIYSMPYYLEVLPKNVSKGAALRWIAARLNTPLSDFAAIGDYDNDLAMLEAAGLGAAPANAPSQVREQADVVVADNNHHAVAELIDRFLLN